MFSCQTCFFSCFFFASSFLLFLFCVYSPWNLFLFDFCFTLDRSHNRNRLRSFNTMSVCLIFTYVHCNWLRHYSYKLVNVCVCVGNPIIMDFPFKNSFFFFCFIKCGIKRYALLFTFLWFCCFVFASSFLFMRFHCFRSHFNGSHS